MLKEFLSDSKTQVDGALRGWFSPDSERDLESPVLDGIHEALFSGGKRIRPALLFMTADALGLERKSALPLAMAVELIHAYSLVHDDLPAMDNSETRRGKPTLWKLMGEGQAVLVGDALLTETFKVLSSHENLGTLQPESRLRIISAISDKSGRKSLIEGQARDLLLFKPLPEESKSLKNKATYLKAPDPRSEEVIEILTKIHALKTGELMSACTELAAIAHGTEGTQFELLSSFGVQLGLLFQATDDLIDKSDLYEIIGEEELNLLSNHLAEEAKSKISFLGEKATLLNEFVDYVRHREF